MIEQGKYGNSFYRHLPQNARIGTIQDFVTHGRKKVGMHYLVYSSIREVYDIQTVREATTGQKIQEYIDAEMLYILTENGNANANTNEQ
jgi:hypothetical protein